MANLANHVACEEDVIEKERDAAFIKADNANGKRSPPKESDFQERYFLFFWVLFGTSKLN